jgi:23S rRNA (uridine2552-2'-O)-methyltransferase
MKRSKSSQRWLQRQAGDPYVRQSKLDGYRSRAAYKLIELQRKDRLMRPGMTVVDLGAAPGGWSQVAAREVGAGGRVLALDLLQMEPIDGVDLIIGDFHEDSVLAQALAWAGEAGVDLVLSDMAPTISGMRAVDQPRSMLLVELAVDFAARVLKPGGAFATKVFQGEGFDATLRDLRGRFREANAVSDMAKNLNPLGGHRHRADVRVQQLHRDADGAAHHGLLRLSSSRSARQVKEVTVQGRTIEGVSEGGQRFTTYSPGDDGLVGDLLNNNVEIKAAPPEKPSVLMQILINWFPLFILIGLWIFFMRQMQGGAGGRGAMSFAKSKARMLSEDQVKVTFADMAGAEEAKEEVVEVVDFLRTRPSSRSSAARSPRAS